MKIYNEYLKIGINNIAVQYIKQPARYKEEKTIILLHEGLGCIEMWKDWPISLAKRIKLNLVIYSRIGMGKSSEEKKKKISNFLHEEALHVLPKIINNYCKSDPILLGHSDGASISIIYAGNRLPCKAIILEAPHVIVESVTIREIKSIKKVWDNSNIKLKFKKYHSNPDKVFSSWCDVWLSREFAKWNITNLLKYITCPILLIQGNEDQFGTKKQLNLIEKNVSSYIKKIILKNCKHSPHLEYPKLVVDYVEEFSKNVWQL